MPVSHPDAHEFPRVCISHVSKKCTLSSPPPARIPRWRKPSNAKPKFWRWGTPQLGIEPPPHSTLQVCEGRSNAEVMSSVPFELTMISCLFTSS
jgi:hypothetical protein